MAKGKKFNLNLPPGATTTSSVKNVSNSGEMSSSSQTTGATGASINTTNIYSTGAAGSSSPNIQVGHTPGPRNWMDDAIDNAIRNFLR